MQRKAQVPSSNSARWRTLDFDITIVNTAVERSFLLYAPDEIYFTTQIFLLLNINTVQPDILVRIKLTK